MNTETENETVQPDQPQNEQQAEATEVESTESVGADEQEADSDEYEDDTDSNGEESSEDRQKKPKRPRWSDVNRANREALEARRREDELRQRLEALERGQQPEPPKPVQSAEKPTLEAFDFDQEAYLTALADWRLDQREAERSQKSQQEQAQQTAQERYAQLVAKEAEFIKAHPDYEGVAKAPGVPITQQMADVMLENPETAPAIAYYLGQNIKEAEQIAQMGQVAAARAIGRIEAIVGSAPAKPNPPPKPVQKAAPVVPTLQPGASATKDWKQMSTDEHIREFRARQQQNNGR